MESSGSEEDLALFHIAVVIPAYRVAAKIEQVVRSIPWYVRTIIVVDDSSPDDVVAIVESIGEPRLVLMKHDRNQGVGGAMLTGLEEALRRGAQICVKIDGDGQMDPALIPQFCRPIISGEADYVKGNRFMFGGGTRRMPWIRKLGNLGLSFMVKSASGYWRIFDPTNGYVVIRREAIESVDRSWIAKDYFFESSMLIALHTSRAAVRDYPLEARYDDELSSLRPWRILIQFPTRLARYWVRRMWFEYFQYDFGMASLLTLTGLPLLLAGALLGSWYWHRSIDTGIPATGGEVMLSALPILASIQMLLQALSFDMNTAASRSQFGPLPPDRDAELQPQSGRDL